MDIRNSSAMREMTENEAACLENSIDSLRKGSIVAAKVGTPVIALFMLAFVVYDIIGFGFSVRDILMVAFISFFSFISYKIAMVTGKQHFIQKPLLFIEGQLHSEVTTFTRAVVCRIESTRIAFPRQWGNKINGLIGKNCKCWYYKNESGLNMVLSLVTDEMELSVDAEVKNGLIDPKKFHF